MIFLHFFDEMTEQSQVKTEIVAKYFGAWTRIMNKKALNDKLAYIDLFAGPGRYKDTTKSTPLKVLEMIINNDELCKKMVTIFNDANPDYAQNLQEEINKLDGIEKLQHEPQVYCTDVGDEITAIFEKTNLVPTLAFIDPWGYKGLSSKLIAALIKDWGSDCIFFFNYNRINMGINNPIVVDHIDAIFGKERANRLRKKVQHMSPQERELTILNDLAESLSHERQNYILPFRFIRPDGTRTSHYLIFVSKHVLGYTIMKDIMWKYSSEHEDGVASFSYIPVSKEYKQLSILLGYTKRLDELGDDLLKTFAGQKLTLNQIFEHHHVGTPFVKANYKEALRRLEDKNLIITDPPADKRRIIKGVRSFKDTTLVTFPK